MIRLYWACLLLGALFAGTGTARAQTFGSCTVSTGSVALGSHSSLALASEGREASGSGGLACSALALLSTSYIKVRVESSTFVLTGGPASQTIPFLVSATEGGPAIAAGAEFDFTGFQLLNLFAGPGGSLPLHVRTSPQPALRAGTYTGTINLRWYFSICTLGVGVCIYSQSPGFVRPFLLTPLNWGTGVPTSLNVTMTVENDCAISAPDLDFGAAPLAGVFDEATRTISIRCSAGAAYTVGLSDGAHPDGGWRRMRRGATADYLRYQIYQTPSSMDRWGSAPAERRGSASAETNPGVYDGTVQQGFTYRARIDQGQATPSAGLYVDSVVVDVAF